MSNELLVTENMGLVYYLANRFNHPEFDYEDLASIGKIGLIKASQSYDQSKGIKFATYAGRCIQNEILMIFRKGRLLTSSLDDPVRTESENITLMDVIASDASVDDDIDRIFAIQELRRAIEKLPVRERFVVMAYYGIDCEAVTQAGIAKYLRCSQRHVARIIRETLKKLREEMEVSI
ncbi:sigma-70 family RNA polymerase sigma factor [Lysinibacillus odysseyi]|uniref:sigma-70 family RNA polymerase sigma factor n=1 Tax=Lysinibacillus odysseyi TaxID=202611 RepID=UPI00068B23FA|nr:sigma-70 family RNA polymerase sigma factor [Lysinibacillus odysseyi]